MTDWTVDVGVVMAASQLGSLEHSASSLELLKEIESKKAWRVALDDRGRILYQYQEKIKKGFGLDWIRRLASTGKFAAITLVTINKGIRNQLRDAHFDPEDLKYVQTAASTDCKLLVSHDPDYSAAVCKILRKVDIQVVSALGAQSQAEAQAQATTQPPSQQNDS